MEQSNINIAGLPPTRPSNFSGQAPRIIVAMATICRSTDPVTREVCQELVDRYGTNLSGLDRGYEETRLVSNPRTGDIRAQRTTTGARDRFVSDPEVWKAALALAGTNPWFRDYLNRKREIPWHENDGPQRAWVTARITAIQSDLESEGLSRGNFRYSVALWQRFFADLSTRQGGCKANCVEFVGIFLMASDIAGIPVVPLELFRTSAGEHQHVRIGLRNPSTGAIEKIADLDASFGPSGYFGKTIAGDVWTEISQRELLAFHYNLKGTQENNPAAAERRVDFALRLAPRHYVFLYNKACLRDAQGDRMAAKKYLLASLRSNPAFPKAWWNLHLVARDLGDMGLSRSALRQYQRLQSK